MSYIIIAAKVNTTALSILMMTDSVASIIRTGCNVRNAK